MKKNYRSLARRRRRGFTLMEVLLVLVILVILGSMVGFYFTGTQRKALVNSARSQIGLFKTPLQTYFLDVGTYPTTSQGLSALVQAPGDLRNPAKWQGPYLEADKGIPADPWGNPYQYELQGGESFRIWSFGPDGQSGTNDDVSP